MYGLVQSLQYLAVRWTSLADTFLTYMLPWRLSRDSKRWSVVQHIFVSFAAMIIIYELTRLFFKFPVRVA